ncbi:hypothetical protein HU200_015589 [Digitaria exilis]|uniref:F-box/LRR-repeat protein 15/At3g58940/PEG3-like LRR domain-containing protein n=1 Tax=Digitaria exilis TaxID=1010633 RepID=A0A835F8U2_9POAL|nr:hypothetical protein HU200_015589 [Digitaria exilis]
METKKRLPTNTDALGDPTGADGSGGGDRIGSLHDGVLGDIISLLPTPDGARTQILSRRWRPLWRSAPLNLDLHAAGGVDALFRRVAAVLAAHPGPCRYARIPSCCLWHQHDAVGTWLLSPALDNLDELHICLCRHGWAHWPPVLDMHPPAQSTFRFSPSLRVLTLSSCTLPDQMVRTLRFPVLHKLALEMVFVLEGSLSTIIADGCPRLECLLLGQSMGFSCVRISSPSLRNVAVTCHDTDMAPLSEIIVKDAPCLEKLVFLQHDHHPGLLVSGLRVIDSKTRVCTIKTIAIAFHSLKLDTVIDLMSCFPCLESLYLKTDSSSDDNLWHHKYCVLLRSLDIRLKKLVLLGHKGTESYANFVTFFIMNARRLETVRFVGDTNMENEEFIAKQHKLLQLHKRASIGAQFYFKTSRCHYRHAHIDHVHDLSIPDPFECTCSKF